MRTSKEVPAHLLGWIAPANVPGWVFFYFLMLKCSNSGLEWQRDELWKRTKNYQLQTSCGFIESAPTNLLHRKWIKNPKPVSPTRKKTDREKNWVKADKFRESSFNPNTLEILLQRLLRPRLLRQLLQQRQQHGSIWNSSTGITWVWESNLYHSTLVARFLSDDNMTSEC